VPVGRDQLASRVVAPFEQVALGKGRAAVDHRLATAKGVQVVAAGVVVVLGDRGCTDLVLHPFDQVTVGLVVSLGADQSRVGVRFVPGVLQQIAVGQAAVFDAVGRQPRPGDPLEPAGPGQLAAGARVVVVVGHAVLGADVEPGNAILNCHKTTTDTLNKRTCPVILAAVKNHPSGC